MQSKKRRIVSIAREQIRKRNIALKSLRRDIAFTKSGLRFAEAELKKAINGSGHVGQFWREAVRIRKNSLRQLNSQLARIQK